MAEDKTHYTSQEVNTFEEMNLDKRILRALSFKEWVKPTPIQATSIPLALKGKDLLIKATTGSGKTAIFLVPILQKLLFLKRDLTVRNRTSAFAVILTPTKELAFQSRQMFADLCRYCRKTVTINSVAIDPANSNSDLSSIISLKCPDIIFGTPSQILKCVKTISTKLVRKPAFLVIDEADVMFTFGFEKDLEELFSKTGKDFQAIVVSATLSREIAIIKTLLPKNLALVRLFEQNLPGSSQLKQFMIECQYSYSKFVTILALFKFNIVRGKVLVFCNSNKQSYKLKLFLESFGISSCVLNNKLPFNSRNHVVEEFNCDKYKIVIATDLAIKSLKSTNVPSSDFSKKDPEFSLSRGIDFKEVSIVLNFDFPQDSVAYIHRAGRTARGVEKGTVLSLISPNEENTLLQCQERLKDDGDEHDPIVKFNLDMQELERLRYRAGDVLSSLNRKTVLTAQKVELEDEMIQSKKLKGFFRRHPNDLAAIQHDKNRAKVILKNKFNDIGQIPSYLVPASLQGHVTSSSHSEYAQPLSNRKRRGPDNETLEYYSKLGMLMTGKKRRKDPLKTF